MNFEGRLRGRKLEELLYRCGDRSKWLKKLPRTFPRRQHNLHPCGGGLSVTHDAGVRDNGKAKTAGTQSRLPAAVELQKFGYGVISHTTPML
jgi:hypothetical protein